MKKTFSRTGSWIDADFEGEFSSNSSTCSSANSNISRKRKAPVQIPTKRISLQDDVQLWIDRHQPKKVQDLAVHHKKIEEIKFWFTQNVVTTKRNHQRPSILLLTGPPGSGKTAAVKAISSEFGLTVQEWSNPSSSTEFVSKSDGFDPNEDLPYVSQTSAFRTFMLRANRYQVLAGLMAANDSEVIGGKGKIVLLEELPPFAIRRKEEFQDILTQYHRSSKSYPLVIVQSESQKEDTVRNLFPQEFITSLRMHQIQMNAVSPTSMVKALTTIATFESSQGVRKFPVPDKSTLMSLAVSSGGDIRAAINALQFACLNDVSGKMSQAFEGQTSLVSTSKSKKSTSKGAKKTAGPNLAAIGGKDPSLDLFHAMGKVLYCKREDDDSTSDTKYLAANLKLSSRRRLIINPEELLDNVTMTTASFVTFLHQNYVDFFTSVASLADAAEYLSRADPFFEEWTTAGKINLSDYGGSIAVRGLCYSNVKTQPTTGMRNFNKPEWFSVAKKAQGRSALSSKWFKVRGLDHSEVSTVFLPYVSKCYGASLPRDLVEVGLFPGSSPLQNTRSIKIFDGFEAQPEVGPEELPDEADLLIEDFD